MILMNSLDFSFKNTNLNLSQVDINKNINSRTFYQNANFKLLD